MSTVEDLRFDIGHEIDDLRSLLRREDRYLRTELMDMLDSIESRYDSRCDALNRNINKLERRIEILEGMTDTGINPELAEANRWEETGNE